jgi:acetolactate decarboxylase
VVIAYKRLLQSVILVAVLIGCKQQSNRSDHTVQVAGAMRHVMWKGQLEGTIALDSLLGGNYYGVGPLEFLRGELLMLNGRAFMSTVLSDSTMKVEEIKDANAPFFVYAQIPQWIEVELPDSITDLKTLDSYLMTFSSTMNKPFAFKLEGKVNEAIIHVVNLPKGTQVSSPEQAHQGQVNYKLRNEEVELIGFFSTKHKGIFTHHDSHIHVHLITTDQSKMGHADVVVFAPKSLRLFFPLK